MKNGTGPAVVESTGGNSAWNCARILFGVVTFSIVLIMGSISLIVTRVRLEYSHFAPTIALSMETDQVTAGRLGNDTS